MIQALQTVIAGRFATKMWYYPWIQLIKKTINTIGSSALKLQVIVKFLEQITSETDDNPH